jgi:16S rRNA C967 or C1407 C5-methylase (RsmB/RsmF family)/NOL1/NOP2/fmu family ribosome biogenesis protein
MQSRLGDESAAFLAALHQPARAGLRVNMLKLSPQAFQALSPWALETVPWCDSGFLLGDESHSGTHAYHAAGLYYLQEPSAMAVGSLVDPQPGEVVLDLSAAPGGKSTHLAGILNGSGWLAANEIHARRAWELAQNLERCGVRNASVLNETPQRLRKHFGAYFDRVLLDAPCSGEGMFRKSAAARRDWSPQYVQGCAVRQAEILREAAGMVRPGGRIVYATCTYNPQENEAVIADFLHAQAGEFTLVEVPRLPGFDRGMPEWLSPPGEDELRRAVRLWLHRAPGEGHFIAVMQRRAAADKAAAPPAGVNPARLPAEGLRLFADFCRDVLAPGAGDLDEERLLLHGSYLYHLPAQAAGLDGLRAVHPGWWLGTLKTGRFEPAHAFALGLRAADAQRTLDLAADDPRTAVYLRGEALSMPGAPGWLLVCVDGFPLGWGKRVGDVVKNFYPKGLRRAG